jgi:hypothetical protein
MVAERFLDETSWPTIAQPQFLASSFDLTPGLNRMVAQ